MLVKCRACGAKIDRATAYKVVTGKVNQYYCNLAEFTDWQQAKKKVSDNKDRLYQLVNEVFGYNVTNSILYKEMQEVAIKYDYSLLSQYITENKAYLSKSMAKDFVSEYAQIRYFMAIIRNNMASFILKQKVIPDKAAEFEFSSHHYQASPKRQGFSTIE